MNDLRQYAIFLWSPVGRISRLRLWTDYLLPKSVFFLLAYVLEARLELGERQVSGLLDGPITTGASLLFLPSDYATSIKRLHDLGMTGVWILPYPLILAGAICVESLSSVYAAIGANTHETQPAVAITILTALLATCVLVGFTLMKRGVAADNKYGPDPLSKDSRQLAPVRPH